MEKLQAKDLRINNLVYYNGNHNEIGIVTGLNSAVSGQCYVYLNNRANNAYDLEDIKPIPLTEEYLLKFGFEKIKISTSINNLFITYYKKDDIVIYNLQDHFEIELITKFGKQFNLFKVFKKQVHILQNLFFCLTGEELTLNN